MQVMEEVLGMSLKQLMSGEIPGIPMIVHGQPHCQSSQTLRILSKDTGPYNEADQYQQFQTDQGSLGIDLALPFPLDDGVNRWIAATAKQKG